MNVIDNMLSKALSKSKNLNMFGFSSRPVGRYSFHPHSPAVQATAAGKQVYYYKTRGVPSPRLLDKIYRRIPDNQNIPIVVETRKQYLDEYIKNQERSTGRQFTAREKEQYRKQELKATSGVVARYTTASNPYMDRRVVIFADRRWSPQMLEKAAWHEYAHEHAEQQPIKPMNEELYADRYARDMIYKDNHSKNKTMPNKLIQQRINQLPVYVYSGRSKIHTNNDNNLIGLTDYKHISDPNLNRQGLEAKRAFYKNIKATPSVISDIKETGARVYFANQRGPLKGQLDKSAGREKGYSLVPDPNESFNPSVVVLSNPKYNSDQETLAHELTHIKQFNRGDLTKTSYQVYNDEYLTDPSEQEARRESYKKTFEKSPYSDHPRVKGYIDKSFAVQEDSQNQRKVDELERYIKEEPFTRTEKDRYLAEKRKEYFENEDQIKDEQSSNEDEYLYK